jgi:hypothetical protein
MQKKYLSDVKVRERYGISVMTQWRWDQDASLGFPRPIYIRGRKYRDEAELDAFDAAQVAAAATAQGANPRARHAAKLASA